MPNATRRIQPDTLPLFELERAPVPTAPAKLTTEHRRPVPVDHTCDGTNLSTCDCTKARARQRVRERRRERTEERRRNRENVTTLVDKPLPVPLTVKMDPLVHTCDGTGSLRTCECARTWMREYQRRRRRNSGLSVEVNRRANLWRMYRITPEEVEALYVTQGGRCAICGRHENEVMQYVGGRPRLDGTPAAKRGLVVDHCHRGGQVRALLCSPCNAGVGSFGEDADRLRAAADWLDKINAESPSGLGFWPPQIGQPVDGGH
ncbi:endonuclease VII domain-containing protein [Modestobacter sp. VKM Ac-2978]|uniref:endonuclease VII domain-containing protein n=1 Tax=Modestobacter sp. VKM Ac-2978 TaxID=3004132 RepID=UPI0022AB4428|nr:endonuclease VII domain-containing protein [Modestobacter sp. VKM Ac-2978]MCZ2850192.1 endonuclease VII domain-containing protein [Modestobacter sp. VKM Ac-2978]